MNRAILGFILAILALALPATARADAASSWFTTPQGKLRLVAAKPVVGTGAHVTLGLEFQLEPHWKIYWRSPGDAGYPPAVDWVGSTNLAGATLAWPAPERFSVLGLETIGYSGAVVLPIDAQLARPGEPLHLQTHVSYLTCSEICVPYDTTLMLDIPAEAGKDGVGYAALIERYQALVPGDGKASGIVVSDAVLRPGSMPQLDVTIASKTPLVAPDVFVEGPKDVLFGAPALQPMQSGLAVLRVPVSGDWASLPGSALTVTVVDGERSLVASVTPVAGEPLIDLTMIATMMGLALLGGLILNLMPCVLPVLSLKLLAALPRAGHTQHQTQMSFLATATGIVLSFLLLALVTATLKVSGVAIGWGVQFQNPLFLVALVAVLVLFACNLGGFFEVPLPRAVAAVAEQRSLGSVATGAFATLLATPCSAPFLGTALGFALASGPSEIIGIFLAMGLGMALPYLLVAGFPRLARVLPRPGAWMIHLRRVLALLLAGTAVWLLWVLAGEIGMRAALAVGLLMAFAALVLGVLRQATRWAMLALVLATALLVPVLVPPSRSVAAASGPWQRFDPAAIAGLVRDGHVVFVDVTADWCLTCKVNERFVLETDAIRAALTAPNVVAMRADWTRPDPAINAYLNRFGRYGIPFNAAYGPAAPGGVPLPELLTPGAVTGALAQAANP